jgi:hypothetical protein
VAAARAIEGVSHDGIILNVSKCEMTAARTLEQAGEGGGSLPVILTTAQVQYIHTVRNAKVRAGGADRQWGEAAVGRRVLVSETRPC